MLWQIRKKLEGCRTRWGSPFVAVRHFSECLESGFSRRVLYAFAGYGNAGDHASMLGARRYAGIRGATVFLDAAVMRSLLRRELKPELLVVGGGGLLQPIFEGGWNEILASGMRFCLVGVGVAHQLPHRPLISTELLREIITRAETCVVRDRATQQIFLEHRDRCDLTYCPSLLELESIDAPDVARDRLLYVPHPSDMRQAGVSGRDFRVAIRSLAVRTGLRYEEISHDNPFTQRLVRSYDRAALCVTSRLHGCIFSYARGTPCVPIVCDSKTQHFYSTFTDYEPRDAKELLQSLGRGSDVEPCSGASRAVRESLISQLAKSRAAFERAVPC